MRCRAFAARKLKFSRCRLAYLNQSFAQTNSVARIASPRGLTMTAGPGSTTIAIPINKTVEPMTKTTTRRACFQSQTMKPGGSDSDRVSGSTALRLVVSMLAPVIRLSTAPAASAGRPRFLPVHRVSGRSRSSRRSRVHTHLFRRVRSDRKTHVYPS